MKYLNTNIEEISNDYYKINSELEEYPLLTEKAREIFEDLANKYDSFGSIDRKVVEEIYELFEYGYMLGIYRSNINEANLENIFSSGMPINFNDTDDTLSLEKKAFFYTSKIHYFGMLKMTPNYNFSGAFILKIPTSYLKKNVDEIKPIYRKDNNEIKLLSEFIYGYVPVSKDYKIKEIIYNHNYSDFHEYNDEDLLYDGETRKLLSLNHRL